MRRDVLLNRFSHRGAKMSLISRPPYRCRLKYEVASQDDLDIIQLGVNHFSSLRQKLHVYIDWELKCVEFFCCKALRCHFFGITATLQVCGMKLMIYSFYQVHWSVWECTWFIINGYFHQLLPTILHVMLQRYIHHLHHIRNCSTHQLQLSPQTELPNY